jgi:outer membrane protein insertion porin family
MPLLRCSAFALSALMMLPASAQYTAKRLVFEGGQPYPQADLETASGLKPGQKFGEKEMGEAAQHIMDTGAFSDIEMTLSGPASGIDVIFKLKPADAANMLPVSFDNIVWLTPEERDTGLKQRVPLYSEKLPAAGSLQNSVQAALQEMLKAKGVTATIETVQKPTTATRPTVAIAYRVTQPTVVLSNVKLGGVTTELAPAERTAIQGMVGKPFDEGIDAHLTDSLLAAYRNAGYLDATLQGLTRTPADDGQGTTKATISAQVVAGDVYHVSSVQWAGSEIFSTDDFNKGLKLHAGDVASSAALRESYQPLLDAHLQRGYVDTLIIPILQLDKATRMVAYTLEVRPGAVYHVASVKATGLSGQAQKDFDTNWRLKPGAVYDSVYASHFLQANTALRSLAPYTGKVDSVSHPETHTTDVTITFFANNPH